MNALQLYTNPQESLVDARTRLEYTALRGMAGCAPVAPTRPEPTPVSISTRAYNLLALSRYGPDRGPIIYVAADGAVTRYTVSGATLTISTRTARGVIDSVATVYLPVCAKVATHGGTIVASNRYVAIEIDRRGRTQQISQSALDGYPETFLDDGLGCLVTKGPNATFNAVRNRYMFANILAPHTERARAELEAEATDKYAQMLCKMLHDQVPHYSASENAKKQLAALEQSGMVDAELVPRPTAQLRPVGFLVGTERTDYALRILRGVTVSLRIAQTGLSLCVGDVVHALPWPVERPVCVTVNGDDISAQFSYGWRGVRTDGVLQDVVHDYQLTLRGHNVPLPGIFCIDHDRGYGRATVGTETFAFDL